MIHHQIQIKSSKERDESKFSVIRSVESSRIDEKKKNVDERCFLATEQKFHLFVGSCFAVRVFFADYHISNRLVV